LSAIETQLDSLIASLNTAGRARRGWKIQLAEAGRDRYRQYGYEGNWTYEICIEANCESSRESIDSEWQTIYQTILSRAQQPASGKWDVFTLDGAPATAPKLSDDFGYAPCELPENWPTYFDHLYGLDPHIERVRRSIDAAMRSGWTHRFHSALIGPPGCGKSDICQSIKNALGEETVLEFDATSTTMAGAQKELAERSEQPRILLVEEIEKAPEIALAWLLSVLDIRANVNRVTARGKSQSDARMLAIATVNNEALFRRMMSGALASRFSNSIHFTRPGRDTLSRILAREIEKVSGDRRWIKATLDYTEERGISDPRVVVAICMCGADALLDGSYQRMLAATEPPKVAIPRPQPIRRSKLTLSKRRQATV
jgi:hypothetical protein